MATTLTITTAEQLLATASSGRSELVRGELVMMTPAGFEHGRVVINISLPLAGFVKEQGLGIVTGAETGFQIGHDPDTVRASDVGFVCTDRVPPETTTGFFQGAPDLAVEVLSPNDRASAVTAKVQDWLAAGCRAVWVADPGTKSVAVYHSLDRIVVLNQSEVLTDDDLLPGFRLSVAEIYAS
jgi:Uma2 family endonuclease